jgi:hypothetical protein
MANQNEKKSNFQTYIDFKSKFPDQSLLPSAFLRELIIVMLLLISGYLLIYSIAVPEWLSTLVITTVSTFFGGKFALDVPKQNQLNNGASGTGNGTTNGNGKTTQ